MAVGRPSPSTHCYPPHLIGFAGKVVTHDFRVYHPAGAVASGECEDGMRRFLADG